MAQEDSLLEVLRAEKVTRALEKPLLLDLHHLTGKLLARENELVVENKPRRWLSLEERRRWVDVNRGVCKRGGTVPPNGQLVFQLKG